MRSTHPLAPYLVFIISLFSFTSAFAQHVYEGKVIDVATKEALPFVHVIGDDPHHGVTTDIDGAFRLKSKTALESLSFSYVGYEQLTYTLKGDQGELLIRMKSTSKELKEVEILPGENPANRIMRQAIKNRQKNNPEKSAFIYHSYNKFVFTTNPDSITPEMFGTNGDSAAIEMKDHFENHHLLLMESVSERKHLPPDRDQETVLASRVSGFQNPSFAVLATEMQSFSVYSDVIEVASQRYVSPLSYRALRKYVYQLEDTFWNDQDTVFVMAFRPRKGKGHEGLEGIVSINTNGFAVQNIVTTPYEKTEDVSYEIEQMYEQVDGQWFPVQLHTNIIMKLAAMDGLAFYGEGRTYIRDIKLDPELKSRTFSHLSLLYDPDMNRSADTLLPRFRKEQLDTVELNTYSWMDSVGKENNFDRIFSMMGTLARGRIPLGRLDLDLFHIFGYNKFEGFRLGLPLRTNDKLSRHFSIGGYGAYGFKDKEWKYGGDLEVYLHKKSELELRTSYQMDVAESGGFDLRNHHEDWNQLYRMAYVQNMDYMERLDAHLRFRALRWFRWKIGGRREFRWNTLGYQYVTTPTDGVTLFENEHIFTEAYAEMRFVWREKWADSGVGLISLGSKYPVIKARVSQGLTGVMDGEYEYTRYEASITKKFDFHGVGKSTFDIIGGQVEGDVPYSKLFTIQGTYGRPWVGVWNSFETMRTNEFISDRFVAMSWKHNFGNLFFNNPKFRPEFVAKLNAGYGWIENPERHNGITVGSMDKGYYEGGLAIEKLLKSGFTQLGFGTYYRFGPYHLPNMIDNFAFRLVASMPF